MKANQERKTREEDGREGVLHNYRQPKPKPWAPEREMRRVPAYEIPGWPSRAEHEAERRRILDGNAVFLKAEDVAKRYGLTVQWVHRCAALKPYRRHAGKYLIFNLDDILEFEEVKVGAGRGFPVNVLRRSVEKAQKEETVTRLKMDIL